MEEIGVLKTFLSYAMWDDATNMPGYVLCGGFYWLVGVLCMLFVAVVLRLFF